MGAKESKVACASEKKVLVQKKCPGYKPPKNDYQLVFEAVKELEYIMQVHFDGQGEQLHEMIGTANQKLSQDLIVDMRALATTRNNLAHEYSFNKLRNRTEFIEKYRKCIAGLNDEIAKRKEEEDNFYNEVVQKHRAKNPLPKFELEEDKTGKESAAQIPSSSCHVACC